MSEAPVSEQDLSVRQTAIRAKNREAAAAPEEADAVPEAAESTRSFLLSLSSCSLQEAEGADS